MTLFFVVGFPLGIVE